MNLDDYKKIIKSRMSDYRYTHSVNVSKEAVRLAKKYGADTEKAAVAGILHDITKETPKEEQLQIMTDGGDNPPAAQTYSPNGRDPQRRSARSPESTAEHSRK